MMSIRVILKSGTDFVIKCTEFTLNKNGLDAVKGYEINGITENKPIYVDWNEVAAIIRLISDENADKSIKAERGI